MTNNKTIDVSVVIVCMNNYVQLRDCLDSIREYTNDVSYEVLLVAYFFSDENLKKLYNEYPWVRVVISNEIRGFSANNNLALRQAQGRYCFILNDDTYMTMPVIDKLAARMESQQNIAIVSPQILRPDGTIQYTGLDKLKWYDLILVIFKLKRFQTTKESDNIKLDGFFQTYNILGAAFMIKTNIFRDLGFFDEKYFYGPEDIALSEQLNKLGYSVFVDADVNIVHLGGATGGEKTRTVCATRPAWRKGSVLMLAADSKIKSLLLSSAIWINSAMLCVYWGARSINGNKTAQFSFMANLHVCQTIFSNLTPLEIFKKYYKAK